MSIALKPLANVQESRAANGGSCWTSEQADPQFLVTERGAPFRGAGGWYRLRVQTSVIEGSMHSPCLYPDYGAGMTELECVSLGAVQANGELDVVVRLKYPVKALRFDPTAADATFRLEGFTIRRLTRQGAFFLMLRAIARSPKGGALTARSIALETARLLLRGRFSEAGERLLRRYGSLCLEGESNYEAWCSQFAAPLEKRDAERRVVGLAATPTIAVVMPVFNPPERWLRRAIESVTLQTYPHWQFCIADDASTAPHVERILAELEGDSRITVIRRASNGHISEASNSALEAVTAPFFALLDHDDELHPDALLHVVEAINAHPEAVILYSDEDKIDEDGHCYEPYFKPHFDPDLLLGQNCISHLGVYRTDAVRAVGGFRKGLEGSQDWDLALRVSATVPESSVVHIPRVLYHWRSVQGSTALAVSEKSYVVEAGLRAVRDHLELAGVSAEVRALPTGHIVVKRMLSEPVPHVSILIPTRDRVDLLRLCVTSVLEKTRYPSFEVVIVDNGSVERETLAYFEELKGNDRVRVLAYPQPFNYSAINNFAAASTQGELICLLNNDIEVISPNWLEEMASHAVRKEIGAVGAMLYYPNDTIQHAGVLVGFSGVAGHLYAGAPRGSSGHMGRAFLAQRLSAVTAACLVIRRSIWNEVGGLDEQIRVAFNDVDFCLRVQEKGYSTLWTPHAELYHHESASRGHEDTPEKRARFKSEVDFMVARWGETLEADRAYNINLSLTGSPFALASPPRSVR